MPMPNRNVTRAASKFKLWQIVIGVLFAATLSACTVPVYVYRYKLSMQLDVNGELKQDATVVEVSQAYQTILNFGYPYKLHEDGEALVFETSNGAALTVPLSDPDPVPKGTRHAWGFAPDRVLFKAYGISGGGFEESGYNSGLAQLVSKRGPREISVDDLPQLLAFADLSKSDSAKYVEPRNLSPQLGVNVLIKKITIEVTDDPITKGIENKIPWLKSYAKNNWDSFTDYEHRLVYHRSWKEKLFVDWLHLD